jgi:PAS domain S-box-containing protein
VDSSSRRFTAGGNPGDLRKTLLAAAGVAVIYYIMAKIGLFFLVQPDGFAAFWPAAGLLPAVLLILRKKDRVPAVTAVFTAVSIANMMAGMSPGVGVAYAAVNCAESATAAWALGRITGGKVGTLGTGAFFRFLLFCVLAICGGSAIFGAAVSVGLGGNPSFSSAFFLWWAADATGMMLITPLLLSLAPVVRSEETIPKDRLVELIVIAVIVCISTAIVFMRSSSEPVTVLSMFDRPWALLVPMMWAGLRLPPRSVSFLSLLLWSIAIFFTSRGYGPYRIPGIPVEASFATLFAFLTVAYISSYVTASLLRETAEGRKREEETQARFAGLFEKSAAVMLLIDPETGRIEAANRAAVDFYGYPEEKLTSMPLGEINTLPPEKLREELDGIIRGKGMLFHFKHRLADGSLRDVDSYAGPSTVGGKTRIYAIVHDVTEHRRAEEELLRIRALLEETQSINRMGGWEYDVANRRITWTPEVYRIYGVGRDYDPNDVEKDIGHFAPDSAPVIERAFRKAVETGEPYDLDLELIHGTGKRIQVRTLGKATRENGKIVRVSGYIADITEQKRAGEERRKLERQLEISRKRESLGTMAGGIAHQFNNLLSGVLGYIELANESLPPASTAGDSLREAEASAHRAAELSRLMLIYVGQGMRHKELREVGCLVQDLLPLIRTALPGNVLLEIDAPPGGPAVIMDPADFHQVLSALVTNAWEAMGGLEGGIRISVRAVRDEAALPGFRYAAASASAGPWACLEVADTGAGMDGDTLERVFDPFFSTKFTGRGLGLPVVQGIVRHYGGAIHVDSHPGRGTTVSVLFPVTEPESRAESVVHSILKIVV